jgi:hypothetical protein
MVTAEAPIVRGVTERDKAEWRFGREPHGKRAIAGTVAGAGADDLTANNLAAERECKLLEIETGIG